MEYIILDLEWNGAFSFRMDKYINEVIEFGAVKVDEELNIIGTFSHLVRPQITKKISQKVKSLTKLTSEQLMTGMNFLQVASRFRVWAGDAVIMTWGISDVLTLIDNFKYYGGTGKIPFLKQYLNLQTYAAKRINYKSSKLMGLSTLADYLNIGHDDIEHHRALDDSILTFRCLKKLYNENDIHYGIIDVDTKFYDRVTFKNTVICDLSNPLISRNDMIFKCDVCGKTAHRESDWILKNRSYRSCFLCKNCHNHFMGRVRFKMKYDGLEIKKTVFPLEEVPVSVRCEKNTDKKDVSVIKIKKNK